MKLLIDIPKEFERHFQRDRFADSLHRLSADAHLLAGNYEQETAIMLIKSFESSVLIPPHIKLIDADALKIKAIERSEKCGGCINVLDKVITVYDIETAPTIISVDDEDIGIPIGEEGER